MSYSSDIDLRLAEIPTTTDPAIFPDMVDIHNAIHILAQYTNQLIRRGDNPSGTEPWDSMPFEHWLWLEAYRDITAGSIVTMVDTQYAMDSGNNLYRCRGVIPGAASGWVNGSGRIKTNSPVWEGITGLALEDCAAGDLCKVGIGPAVIKLEGVTIGEPIYCYRALVPQRNATFPTATADFIVYQREKGETAGNMFRADPAATLTDEMVCVARGIGADAAMICAPGHYWPDDRNYVPPTTGGGGGFNNS